MKKILRIKKEIPQESFLKMMSSSAIVSDDVIEMFGHMVESIDDTDVFGKPIQKLYSPVGEGFSNLMVCELKITDLSYLKMKDENLLGLDGQFAFVLNNEMNETIVWPILSKTVYVFCTNPFRLNACKWYENKLATVQIFTKERELGKDSRLNGDPMLTQVDEAFRVFKVKKSGVLAKKDYVKSTLRWDKYKDLVENCTRHYPPMWLLRNEPEKLKPQPKSHKSLAPLYPK